MYNKLFTIKKVVNSLFMLQKINSYISCPKKQTTVNSSVRITPKKFDNMMFTTITIFTCLYNVISLGFIANNIFVAKTPGFF